MTTTPYRYLTVDGRIRARDLDDSSGRRRLEGLAWEALAAGAEVAYVSGPVDVPQDLAGGTGRYR